MTAEKAALDAQIAATDAARTAAMEEARQTAAKASLLESQVVQLQRHAEDTTHALQDVMVKMQTNHEVGSRECRGRGTPGHQLASTANARSVAHFE